MNKSRFFAFLSAIVLAAACRQAPPQRRSPELLRTVPTDALVVMPASSLGDALTLALDSSSLLRRLDWGRLKDKDAVISFVYNSKLSPIVCVEAGRSATDTLQDVKSILEKAPGSKAFAGYIPSDASGTGRNILVVCLSEAVYSATMRHLEAGRSVLDAPDFGRALELATESNAVFIRNDGWDKILPRQYLPIFNRRELVKFAKGACDWTVVVPDRDAASVRFCRHDDSPQFVCFLEDLKGGESLLPAMIPEDASFALSMPVGDGFRESYRNWRYVSSNLDKYDKELARLAKLRGTKPLEWEKTAGVRELGLIQWGKGRKVMLVRCAKEQQDSREPVENEIAGFVPALYGSAFGAVKDSCCIFQDGWRICGMPDDLKAYSEAERAASAFLSRKDCKFAIWQPGRLLVSDNKGTTMTNE